LKKNLIKIKFYKLNPKEQNKIFHDIFHYQASFLYNERDKLIEIYDNKREPSELTHLIGQLHHYRKSAYLPEFTIKSYAYLYILNRICMNKAIHNFVKNKDHIIKAQIDGGNIFSFWWYDFLKNHSQKEIFENKLFINGISHGDQYYLSMNLAGLFSNSFREDPQFFYNYPMEDITYNFDNIIYSKDFFYESIWYFLKNFHFQNRVLFIGESELYYLIPYLLHFKKRSIIHQPFKIEGDIKEYFKYFKVGSPEKNLVIHSHKLNKLKKQNIEYCKDLGIKIMRIEEFKEDYSDFNDLILEHSDYYDSKTKRQVTNVLEKYKNYF